MKTLIRLFIGMIPLVSFAQDEYEPSIKFPFGRLNPHAPKELLDFKEMIGICDCKSLSRKPDGTWADTVGMTWKFKYIMNGTAIQDETSKKDGIHAGSIRQYSSDSARWYVHYYTSVKASPSLPAWGGKKNGDKIILYNRQKAPNGQDGFYKITFYNISARGFDWIGEWVNPDESIIYPTWKIFCRKRME